MLYLETIEERLMMSSVGSPAPNAVNLAALVSIPRLPTITTPFRSTRDLSLTGFTLVDTTTRQSLGALVEGETIDLATLPKHGLSIQANTRGSSVPSIVFGYDHVAHYHVENYLPYTLIGSGDNAFTSWQPTVGSHKVTATAHISQYGFGRAGTPISVDFKVINSAAVTGFTLINADNNQAIGPLVEGQTLNLSSLPTTNLTVVATADPGTVGSVVFGYDDDASYHTENYSNYSLNGKTWNGYYSWTPTLGGHTVTATPYSAAKGLGAAGTGLTVNFNVINGPAVPPPSASVTSFSLVDTDNDQTLSTLTEGQSLDLALLPTQDHLAIIANTDVAAGSVVFGYDDNASFQMTDTAPYALDSWSATVGNHTIVATPYSDLDGMGDAGTGMTLNFSIINSTPVTPAVIAVTGFTLVDAHNNQALGPLVEGETIDLSTLPTQNLTIVANTDPGTVGSIGFGYDGNASFQFADIAPYSLVSWTPAVGNHTLTATPYSAADGAGDAGEALAVDFQIVDSTPVIPPVLTAPTTITGFQLIDNDNGQYLGSLVEGGIIDLGTLPTQDVSIVAVPSDTVGSVVFGLDGAANTAVSDSSPYAMGSSLPAIGAHTVTATSFDGPDGSDKAGTPSSVDFTIIDSTAVTGFFLINVDTGQPITELTQGETIDLAALPTQNLAIGATTTDTIVNSVQFGYDGNANFFLQNISSNTPDSWTPALGSHTIIATPFSAEDAGGLAGTPLSVTFSVVNTSAVTSFSLINTDNGQTLQPIAEGQSIDLGKLPTQDMAIVANTSATTAGTLVFGYDGNSSFDTETTAPYTMALTAALGSHTVTATPSTTAGFAGSPLTVDFTVINSTAVTGFTLINLDNGQSLGAVTQGQSIDLGKLPTQNLAILAGTTATNIGSVIFGYDSNSQAAVDDRSPYSLTSFSETLGSHTVTATPYSGADGTQLIGAPLIVQFTLIDSTAVTGFTLINADTGKAISALVDGQTLDLFTLPTKNITIAATTTSTVIGSVVFGFDGNASYQTDNSSPYYLTSSFTPSLGSHTVSATPYSAANGSGLVGTASTAHFTVVDTTPPPNPNNPNLNVSITNPINGASQAGPGYYVIRTSTSDTNSTINNVSFYVNGALLGKADAAPYSMAWENAAPGAYVLTAVATDPNGTTTSSAVNVTITTPVTAHTIYVSTSGSNSNNGLSQTSALQTITAAANIAKAGDTVVIAPGTYPETVTVPNSGTATQPITFKAATPGTVIIDGADALGGWTAGTGVNPIFTTAWNHDFFHAGSRTYFGFTTDGTTTAVGYAEQFLYNNKPLIQVITASQMAAGDFYIDYTAHTVNVWLPGGATPTSSNILASTRSHLFMPASTSVQYIRVDGLIFQHAANFSQDQAVQTATGWRITNTTAQWIGAGAIGVKGDGVLLMNDHALNNGQTGIGGTGNNNLFIFDETAGNNYKGFSVFNEAGGGKFAKTDGAYFDQYFAHDNIGPGLWFDIHNTNYTVVNSFFYNNKPRVQNYEGVGLEVEISDGPGLIKNNTFYGNTGAALDICESMNVTAENNTFHNSYLELRDLAGRDPYHIQNVRITANNFDNSFISTSSGTWTTTSGTAKQIFIDNDIFHNSGPLMYWNGTGYSSTSSIASILGFEASGKLGAVTFTPAPSVV